MPLHPEKHPNPRRGRARSAAVPGFIEPCHPTPKERAPQGSEWLYEIKTDGYRAQVHIRDGKVTVYTRNGHDWTNEFGAIATAAAKLEIHDAILDGEATVLGSTGAADFQALRRELGQKRSSRLLFYAFDVLWLDGQDLRARPLIERKKLLQRILKHAPKALSYVDHFDDEGQRVFEHACRMHLEGLVAKRKDAPYRSARQESWIKLKCVKSDTFPIIAFVEKLGAKPRRIASLYLGRREGDRLLYAGKAQSGYTLPLAQELRERLDPLMTDASPLTVPVHKPKATWVEPLALAEIEFSGVTDDGLLRAPVFKGLRDDLAAPAAAPKPNRRRSPGISRANILQLLPDATAPSEDELQRYWRRVADRALEHLDRRPLKLVRNVNHTIFYHKGPLPPIPRSVHQLKVQKREGGEGTRLWIDDLDGLVGLVEIGAVELHPWNATVDDIELADRIIIDLDPGEGIEWGFMVETALALRDLLKTEGFKPWPKLTGSKGIHVMAPLGEPILHDRARNAARALAQRLAERDPDKYIITAKPEARTGRIFLDYLRNGRGNTACGAWSPPVRAGFPIARPVTWKQIEGGIRAEAYTMLSPFKSRRLEP
jgi:bifunctional non-homologous end joining protein LigD